MKTIRFIRHAESAAGNELRNQIRSTGFCTKGPRRAFRLRKISGGVNTALDDARGLVREILGGDVD